MHDAAVGSPNAAGRSALDGVLVADFSRVLAGPLATMVLGDLGATVVKVEHPLGDDTRRWGPPFLDGAVGAPVPAGAGEPADSTYFLCVNRNKRSVVLDLATEDGSADARRLAERATVLVENFRPGRLARLGLGYEELAAVNPGLVYCSISGFGGGDRPGASIAGYDFVVQAMSGLMDVTGPPDGPPYKTGVAVVDVVTGLYATIGILAALAARRETGQGQLVEVDLMSTALASLVNQASAFLNAGVVPRAMGNQHPSIAPYETLSASDGQLALAAGNDGQFRALCVALGEASLADDPRFDSNAGRVEHRSALVEHLERLLGSRPVRQWVDELRNAGIPCGPVNDVAAAFADAARLGLAMPVEQHRGDGTPVRSVASPLRLSATPASYRLSPPVLGRDTKEVKEWLHAPSDGGGDGPAP